MLPFYEQLSGRFEPNLSETCACLYFLLLQLCRVCSRFLSSLLFFYFFEAGFFLNHATMNPDSQPMFWIWYSGTCFLEYILSWFLN